MGRLLYTGPYLAGQGGATPFLDRSGRLRLIYHAWRTGNVGYPKRQQLPADVGGLPAAEDVRRHAGGRQEGASSSYAAGSEPAPSTGLALRA